MIFVMRVSCLMKCSNEGFESEEEIFESDLHVLEILLTRFEIVDVLARRFVSY